MDWLVRSAPFAGPAAACVWSHLVATATGAGRARRTERRRRERWPCESWWSDWSVDSIGRRPHPLRSPSCFVVGYAARRSAETTRSCSRTAQWTAEKRQADAVRTGSDAAKLVRGSPIQWSAHWASLYCVSHFANRPRFGVVAISDAARSGEFRPGWMADGEALELVASSCVLVCRCWCQCRCRVAPRVPPRVPPLRRL